MSRRAGRLFRVVAGHKNIAMTCRCAHLKVCEEIATEAPQDFKIGHLNSMAPYLGEIVVSTNLPA